MFFLPRRRPLLGAAMIGGAGFLAGRRRARASYHESEQEERLQQLEDRPTAESAPAAAPGGGSDIASKLKELSDLVDSGALSKDEFEAAKRKLLAG